MVINNSKIESLHMLRGLAAFYVMVGHVRWLIAAPNVDFFSAPVSLQNKISIYLLSIFRFGHEAVLVFFLLSGFVIHLSISKQIATGGTYKFNFKDYFFKRFIRIYPPFILALIITFSLDIIAQKLLLTTHSHTTPYPIINSSFNFNFSLPDLGGNLLFAYPQYAIFWGSDGPLWSLKYEWWFYLLYPLFIAVNRWNAWVSLLLVFLIKVLVINLIYDYTLIKDILVFFDIWFMGAIMADIFTKRIKININFLIPLILLLPFCLFKSAWIGFMPSEFWPYFGNLLFGLGIIGLIAICIRFDSFLFKSVLSKALIFLGDISFSLYIIHLPFLLFISGLLMKQNSEGHLPNHFWFVLPSIAFCTFLGWLCYQIVERPVVDRNYRFYYKKLFNLK